MASIGLRIDHGTAGTDLAATLAKALTGNVSDQINIARLKSNLATDEIERQRLRELKTLATQQAIAQAKENQYKQAEYDAKVGMQGALSHILQAQQQGQQQATEAPVVVADTMLQSGDTSRIPEHLVPLTSTPSVAGGRGMPESLVPLYPQERGRGAPESLIPTYPTEPDIGFSGYPLRSDEPVPVELPPLPGQAELAGVPPQLQPPSVPLAPQLQGVPPDLADRAQINVPLPIGGVHGVPPGLGGDPMLPQTAPLPTERPYRLPNRSIGAPAATPVPDWLRQLLGGPQVATPETDAMLQGMEHPVVAPELPPGFLAPPAPLDAEPPVPIEPRQGPPAPLPPGVLTPPADLDLQAPRPQQGPPQPSQPLPPGLLTPPAELDRPAVRADMPGADVLSSIPPELRPVPIEDLTRTNVPGRPPVLPAEAPPLPTTVAPVSPTPPSGPPAAVPAAAAEAPKPSPTAETPTMPARGTITTKAPGSVGTGVVHADGSSTYQTTEGPVRLSQKETDALALGIAMGADPGGQATKLSALIKVTFDPGVTLTPNQKAELLSGQKPLGTPEETASQIAVAAAKPEIREVDKRLYTITPDGKGGQVATLIPGQPEQGAVNPYGDTEKGNMLNYVDSLLLKGLKNATPEQQRHFVTMIHQLWGSDVKVAADGTVVTVAGDPAPGFPTAGEAFKSGSLPAPATDTGAAAPAAAAPAAAAPAAAAPATAAGTAKKNEHGRYLRADGNPSYGGYLVEGQQPPEPVEQTAGGRKVTITKPAERTKEAETQTAKQVSYTRQALEPAAYFLKLKKGDVKVTALQDIMTKMAEDTPVEKFVQRYAMSADEREYFRNVIEIVKDMSHKDSGADVTKSDLVTYRGLYELPLDPTEKDLALLRRSIRTTLRGAREGFNGAVPSEELRSWDSEAGRQGINLDVREEIPTTTDTGTAGAPREEDIAATMKARNMTRQQVLDALDAKKKREAQ